MRKSVQVALGSAVVLLLVACAMLYVKVQNTTTASNSSKAAEAETQTRYAKTIDAIAEIQDSLSAISVGDTNVAMQSQALSFAASPTISF